MPFLTARWSNLCLLTYAVPPALLAPRLAPGLELDTRDGRAFVSLVAFDFLDTRVLGVPWPGFRNFAEINLRFYVRHADQRGVMFLREFVPQRLVAFLARTIYNEPYVAAPLTSRVTETPDAVAVEHRLEYAGRTHRLRVVGGKPSACPADESVEAFFKEHRWGFGRDRAGRCIRYEVLHPAWHCHPVHSCELDFDFGLLYGPEWAFLADETPYSRILAAGSAISVSGKAHVMPTMPVGR